MGVLKDITGKKFGRLTVLKVNMSYIIGKTYWDCVCDCGNIKTVKGSHLKDGFITSCGCYMVQCTTIRNTTHGNSKKNKRTTEYVSWRAMKQRCNSNSYHAKHRYSERGITICERWENSFECFLQDMGLKPTPKHTLERVDNDKGYYKENCAWKTIQEQQKNKSYKNKVNTG